MNPSGDPRLVPILARAIDAIPGLEHQADDGSWPSFKWMGCVMSLARCRKLRTDELKHMIQISRDGVRLDPPRAQATAKAQLAGFMKLESVDHVDVAEYENTPEGSDPKWEPFVWTIRFYVDALSGHTQIYIPPPGRRA